MKNIQTATKNLNKAAGVKEISPLFLDGGISDTQLARIRKISAPSPIKQVTQNPGTRWARRLY